MIRDTGKPLGTRPNAAAPRRRDAASPPERRITHALCVRSPLKVSGFTRSGFRAHAAPFDKLRAYGWNKKAFCSLALCPAHRSGNSTVKESMPPPSTRTPLPETAFARLRREERHRLDASRTAPEAKTSPGSAQAMQLARRLQGRPVGLRGMTLRVMKIIIKQHWKLCSITDKREISAAVRSGILS